MNGLIEDPTVLTSMASGISVKAAEESKRIIPNLEIKPEGMVFVVDEFLAPAKWPLAGIVNVIPGPDGLIRVVDLRTSRGIIRRPITKICLLLFEDTKNA